MSVCLLLQKKADACRVSHSIWSQKINSPDVIRESGKFLLEESGIMGFGIPNTFQGIRNPTNNQNPESKLHWKTIRTPFHEIQNP